jgi:hypothetical protein
MARGRGDDADDILSTASFDHYGKPTRRAVFLAEIDQVVPWAVLRRLVVDGTPSVFGTPGSFLGQRVK